jgi:LPXTG-motif cell wall-anchored protein
MPSRNLTSSSVLTVLGALMVGLAGLFSFRDRGRGEEAQP